MSSSFIRTGPVVAAAPAPLVAAAPAPFVAAAAPATVVKTAPVVAAAAPIVRTAPLAAAVKVEEFDAHPQYQYAYNVQDHLTGDSKSKFL